ncbi:hypothetical protein GGI02_003743 [Coemansia sp. RSA 2322]|uniref:protein-histidine N-methyltransferase n=1 Tax=Coemansia thaxteri TaxID=2663907 RepID=A0A9W8BFR9_9FUNG|nr:hypothetical protein H4R26_000928 [Coemansia thaxteri]KAJ2468311.1 hypothetical protein GGI02_003743 [Coemansia sp. RSA 2322]
MVFDAIYYGEQRLWKRQIDDVQFQLAQQDDMSDTEDSFIKRAISGGSNASDVIRGVYEGGLKTWECSMDLLSYLVRHGDELQSVLSGARVLEIGCGTGLPSLHILKHFPSASVSLQDYNRDVLDLVTIPNVIANTDFAPVDGVLGDSVHFEDDTETCEVDLDFRRTQVLFGTDTDKIVGERETPELTSEEAREADTRLLNGLQVRDRCEFIAGDWALIEQELRAQRREHTFNMVLTSETIYDVDSYAKLHDLLCCVLAKPDSARIDGRCVPMALVAAKSIYFGLSGSVLSFQQYVQRRGVFDVTSIWQSGGSMPREILRLVWCEPC